MRQIDQDAGFDVCGDQNVQRAPAFSLQLLYQPERACSERARSLEGKSSLNLWVDNDHFAAALPAAASVAREAAGAASESRRLPETASQSRSLRHTDAASATLSHPKIQDIKRQPRNKPQRRQRRGEEPAVVKIALSAALRG